MRDRRSLTKLVIGAVLFSTLVIFLYKLDVFRRVGCIALSHLVGSYEAQFSKDPYFRDPSGTVRVFSTQRSMDEVRSLYERLLRMNFVEVLGASETSSFRVRRGVVGYRPFSYVVLIEIEQKGNTAPKVLIVCGDVFRPFR